MAMVGDRPSTDVAVTPEKVVEMARAQRVQIVDLRFTDLFGMWQHFSIPVKELTPELFEEGIGFDGSSIRGFQHIHESDLILMADAETAVVDRLSRVPTLLLTCDVYDPVNLVYSKRNRSAAVRIPGYSSSPRSVRVEYRPPDPSEFYLYYDV
jgi:glutamine synthetase